MSGLRKACRVLVAVALTGAAVMAMPPPAGSQHRLQRCPAERRPSCVPIKDTATVPSHTVAAAALGNRLAEACDDGDACDDDEACAEADAYAADDDSDDSDGDDHSDAEACANSERPARLLRPFPVVRVKGTLLRDGALISLLRVRAPARATVDARCNGPRCRVRQRSLGSGRIPALERFLHARTRITIRVSKPNSVGKYVRLVIRDGTAPRRRDACLMPGSGRPAECPPT